MEYYSSLDASQLDSETPTLFELISANQLESLLSPSLRYILVHYAQRYPAQLLKLTNRFDEINLVLRSFIEWYFFKYWQGSFTENFYGLKRVSQTPLSSTKYNSGKLTQLVPSMVESRRELSVFQRWISIFEVTGVAYASEKLSYTYEIWHSMYITNQLDVKQAKDKKEYYQILAKRLFVEFFPTLQSLYRAGNFAATLLYLSGNSKSPSLITYLFGINYSRLNQNDYAKNDPNTTFKDRKKPNRIAPPTTIEYILRLLQKRFSRPVWGLIKLVLGTFFPVAIFTLKFLEWWNNSNFALQIAKSQGNSLDTVIPPPSTFSKSRDAELKPAKVYKSGKTCPLCKDELKNPAIIETGYVFCYTCIYNYLSESHKIVGNRVKKNKEAENSDSDSEEEEEEKEEDDGQDEKEEKSEVGKEGPAYDLEKGGRCPITGRKLLGCKWNALKEEYDVDGIRRLIF